MNHFIFLFKLNVTKTWISYIMQQMLHTQKSQHIQNEINRVFRRVLKAGYISHLSNVLDSEFSKKRIKLNDNQEKKDLLENIFGRQKNFG